MRKAVAILQPWVEAGCEKWFILRQLKPMQLDVTTEAQMFLRELLLGSIVADLRQMALNVSVRRR